MTTVNGQVSVAPTGKEAAVPLLATQAPTVTVAPAGVPAVAVQVALVAAVVVETLVQTKLPVRLAPGAAVAGKPVICTLMSAANTGTFTDGSQACPVAAVHAGSPPPLRLAELLPPLIPTAVSATFTGTRTMMVPTVAPVLI